MHVSFVVAIADNGVIGRNNGLPWRLAGDMAWFRQVTKAKPLVMGRKTWDSLPRKPLPGRPNIVITRDASFKAEGAEVFTDAMAALARARDLANASDVDEVCVIGGAQIYDALFDDATRLYITEVHDTPEGEVSFPSFDGRVWKEVSRELHEAGEKDTSSYSFVVLERDGGETV